MKINTLVLDVNGFLTKELDYLHTLKQGFFNFMGFVMVKEERKEYMAKYMAAHKTEKKEWDAKYRLVHKDKIKEYNAEYRATHKKELKILSTKYEREHKKYRREYKKQRRSIDPLYKMMCYLRNRTRRVFKAMGLNKPTKTEELLGADFRTVMQHIEAQFIFGMSWDNHGEWHIDHKKPLAEAKTEKRLIKLCHYTNLQPLWAKDNIGKGAKLNYTTNTL